MICKPPPLSSPLFPIGEGSLRLEGWPNPRTTRVTTRSTSGMAVSQTWDREVGWGWLMVWLVVWTRIFKNASQSFLYIVVKEFLVFRGTFGTFWFSRGAGKR